MLFGLCGFLQTFELWGLLQIEQSFIKKGDNNPHVHHVSFICKERCFDVLSLFFTIAFVDFVSQRMKMMKCLQVKPWQRTKPIQEPLLQIALWKDPCWTLWDMGLHLVFLG